MPNVGIFPTAPCHRHHLIGAASSFIASPHRLIALPSSHHLTTPPPPHHPSSHHLTTPPLRTTLHHTILPHHLTTPPPPHHPPSHRLTTPPLPHHPPSGRGPCASSASETDLSRPGGTEGGGGPRAESIALAGDRWESSRGGRLSRTPVTVGRPAIRHGRSTRKRQVIGSTSLREMLICWPILRQIKEPVFLL